MTMWMLPRLDTGAVAETPLSAGPVPGLGEIAGAGLDSEAIRVDAFNLQERRYRTRLEDLADAVFGQSGGPQQEAMRAAQRRRLRADPITGRQGLEDSFAAEVEGPLFNRIGELSQAGVGPFRDLPKSAEELRARVEAEVKRELEQAEGVLGRREEGGAEWLAEFVGAAIGGLSTPDLALLPFGAGGAMPLWRRVLLEGALGAAGEGASLPAQFRVAEQFGLAAPDAGTQIAAAAAFAGGLPIVGRALVSAGGKAVSVTNDALVRSARERAASLPPAERGALNAAERELGTEALRPAGVERIDFNADVRQAEGAVVLGRPDLLPERQASAEAIAPRAETPPATAARTGRASDAARRIVGIESGGRADAANPNSSALGAGQFIDTTWLSMIRKHRPDLAEGRSEAQVLALRTDADLSLEMVDAYRRDGLKFLGENGLPQHDGAVYLHHFAGPGGAKAALSADPAAPIGRVLSAGQISANAGIRHNGKSFAEFTAGDLVDWARSKMGLATGNIEDYPVSPAVYEFDPRELRTDAVTFQYKSGGDAEGVTERLLAEKRWEPDAAIGVMVYEAADGARYIADGHQRLGLARRLIDAGDESIRLEGRLYREVDGWTPDMFRVKAAMKNILAETGSPLDAARIVRDHPELRGLLNAARGFMQQADGLAKLTNDPFMAIVNGAIPEHFGAAIGRIMPGDEDLQLAAIGLFERNAPENAAQAEAMAREVRRLGLEKRDSAAQGSLFGDMGAPGETRILDRARVLDAAIRELKNDRRLFERLNREQDRIEEAGNVIEATANEARRPGAERAIVAALRLADEPGPVRDALDAAAGSARTRGVTSGRDQFLDALRDAVESGAAFRAGGRDGADGLSGAPRAGEPGALDDAPAGSGPGAALDEPPADQGGLTPPGLFDDPVEGTGARAEAAMLDREVRQAVGGGVTGGERGPFGPIVRGFTDDPEGAISRLVEAKDGEVPDAFVHPEIGPVAFVWGKANADPVARGGFGLAHILEDHGASSLAKLPEVLRQGTWTLKATSAGQRGDRYLVDFVGENGRAWRAVVALDHAGTSKRWVVTNFRHGKGDAARRPGSVHGPASSAPPAFPDATGRLEDGLGTAASQAAGARQARTSNVPPASAPTRIPDATGRAEDGSGAGGSQAAEDPGAALARAHAEFAAARAEGEAQGWLDIPDADGLTAAQLLKDLDADAEFTAVVETVCSLRFRGTA